METTHGYRAFGLNIRSFLEVPKWPAGGPPWDVVVERGEVARELPGAEMLWDGKFLGRVGECILDFPRAGRMRIERGERVTIAPDPAGPPVWLATLLATTGFAALLYQRGGLCLHASAVAHEGRVYLIMGPSGAGKSTTASALLQRGCQFVSDDITMVTPRPDGGFDATASFPTVRLKFDSHEALDFGAHATPMDALGDDKVHLRYHGPVVAEPLPIARICFLESDATLALPKAAPLLGQERVSALQRSLFRRQMARIVTDPTRLAAQSIALAQRVDVIRLTRPQRGFALDELCALVLG